MLIRPAIGNTDPIRYRCPNPDGQLSGNIIDEAMRGRYCKQMALSDEKDVLRGVLAALDPFRKLRETMPLQYVRAFILVATEEGSSVGEYARRARIAPALMTRAPCGPGHNNRYHEAGFGLVKQFYDAMDKRVRLIRPLSSPPNNPTADERALYFFYLSTIAGGQGAWAHYPADLAGRESDRQGGHDAENNRWASKGQNRRWVPLTR